MVENMSRMVVCVVFSWNSWVRLKVISGMFRCFIVSIRVFRVLVDVRLLNCMLVFVVMRFSVSEVWLMWLMVGFS